MESEKRTRREGRTYFFEILDFEGSVIEMLDEVLGNESCVFLLDFSEVCEKIIEFDVLSTDSVELSHGAEFRVRLGQLSKLGKLVGDLTIFPCDVVEVLQQLVGEFLEVPVDLVAFRDVSRDLLTVMEVDCGETEDVLSCWTVILIVSRWSLSFLAVTDFGFPLSSFECQEISEDERGANCFVVQASH